MGDPCRLPYKIVAIGPESRILYNKVWNGHVKGQLELATNRKGATLATMQSATPFEQGWQEL